MVLVVIASIVGFLAPLIIRWLQGSQFPVFFGDFNRAYEFWQHAFQSYEAPLSFQIFR